MKTVRQHFPWMTAAEEPVLRTELLRRAAVGFEQAGQLSDAAECWRDAGEPIRASEMHVRNGDLGRAAEQLLAAGRHHEALQLFQAWEKGLLEADVANRVQALLGQAACHLLGTAERQANCCQNTTEAAIELSLRSAREIQSRAQGLILTTSKSNRPAANRCWETLGEFGKTVGRQDLLQTGYEEALRGYELGAWMREKVKAGRAYLEAARTMGDLGLIHHWEEQVAEWGFMSKRSALLNAASELYTLDPLKADVVTNAGKWVGEFGIETSGNEPPQFRHYFIVMSGSEWLARGSIVTGNKWDRSSIPGWRVVHGWGKADGEWYEHVDHVSYLGPKWDPLFVALSEHFVHLKPRPELNQFNQRIEATREREESE